MTEITEILKDITQIRKLYSFQENSIGSRFNLFKIIELTTDEERLHSKFIAELLNPSGSHGQGALFLEKFIESTGTKGILNKIDNVTVDVEFSIGPVTEISGGRIDILLRDQCNNLIIIENKINAGDQENQLLRYYNFAKGFEKKGGQFEIIYLTLFDKSASDFSLGLNLTHEDYISISYQENIISWLESCYQVIIEKTNISVGINHYIELIKYITHQDYSMEFQNSIIQEIVKDVESFKAAGDISHNLLNAKAKLLYDFGKELVAKLKANVRVKDVFFDVNFGRQYKGIEIFLEELKQVEDRPPHIRFSFLRNTSDCYLEIHPGFTDGQVNPKNHFKRQEYIELLNNHFDRSIGKVMNVEQYWQGEWVIEYHRFNNRFEDIIVNMDSLIDEILIDISFLIDKFFEVEQG